MGTLGEYLRYIVDVFYIFCLFVFTKSHFGKKPKLTEDNKDF